MKLSIIDCGNKDLYTKLAKKNTYNPIVSNLLPSSQQDLPHSIELVVEANRAGNVSL